MSAWDWLEREFDAWGEQNHPATLWWRDDDAVSATPALEALLDLGHRHGVPVSLAVIPKNADTSLVDRLHGVDGATALQHGWAHANHAPPTSRKAEFGPHRPLAEMLADLRAGWSALARFSRRLPVLVAPWNRIDKAVIAALPQTGLHGVSTLGPRPAATAAPGVRQTNVHVDIIDWKGSRQFAGEERVLGTLAGHLRDRRLGAADAHEPTGLMTHHLAHDDACWVFLDKLFSWIRMRPSVRWLDGDAVFSR